jgi:curved DNA-binding protein CbpA
MSGKDPKGFYARLGVEPTANAEDIRVAFRRIAKELHPDKNTGARATSRFQAINEAYQTLNNSERRTAYDAQNTHQFTAEKETPQTTKLDPVCCSRCNKVTAQPRSTVFRYVVSFVVGTARHPIQGIFCSSCARKAAIKASLISAFAGWWAFPFGPIYTLADIARNAIGGERSTEAEESLLWYNAMAFYSQGRVPIAVALAQQLRSAKDKKIANDAVQFIDHLDAAGVAHNSGPLKNPWSPKLFDLFAHAACAGALPFLIIAAANSQYEPRSNTYRPIQIPTYQTSVPAAAPRPTLPVNAANASWNPTPQSKPVPICARPPVNGDVLSGNLPTNGNGHTLEIRNGSGGNAIVRARNAMTGHVVVSFFVANNSTATFENLPDASYRIQYAFGTELRADCKTFVGGFSAGQFPGIESLSIKYTDT